jgi:hypothetical protein
MFISDPDRIQIRPKVSDPYGSGSGSGSTTLSACAIKVEVVFINENEKKNGILF